MLVFYLRVGVVVVLVNFFLSCFLFFLSYFFVFLILSYSLLSRLLQVDFFCFVLLFLPFLSCFLPASSLGQACHELISEADLFFVSHLICLLFDGSSSGSLTFLRDRGERQPAPLLIRLRTLNAPD